MKRLIGRFMNSSLRSKMMATYILIALIPFTIFSLYMGITFLNDARSRAIEYTEQLVNQVGDSLDIYIESISKMMKFSCLELADLLREYRTTTDQDRRIVLKEMLEDRLNNMVIANSEIAGVFVATAEDYEFSTGMSRISKDPFHEEDWYQAAVKMPAESQIISSGIGRNITTNTEYSVDDVFCMVQAIQDPLTGETIGVLLLDIKHDIIKQSIDSVKIGREGFVFITDSADNVVYAQENPVIYRVNPKWLNPNQQDSLTVSIRGGSHQIAYITSEYSGWKTIGVFSFEEVMSNVGSISVGIAISILVNIILIIIVSYLLTSATTNQILDLKNLMTKAESGDFTVRFVPKYKDEVGELGATFNHMLNRIQKLIDMVYKEQQHKRTAELKSLQEQVKPHFLYNTLDTIGWMAREYNAMEIVHLLDALTNMFRVGLSHGKDYITVKEEIAHVSNYLYIQKARYQDKLNYKIEMNQDIYDNLVPKLILQPLVENAIYHGIKTKRGGGTITLSGWREGGEYMIFSIHDDGAGIKSEKLAGLKAALEGADTNKEKQSFGLFYIKERIQLSYGEEYGMTIDSKEDQYTVITIKLPIRTVS